MTQVWFKGPGWCPRHEQGILLLADSEGRPVLRFTLSQTESAYVLNEIARGRAGCSSGVRLLQRLLAARSFQPKSVVFEQDGELGARIELLENGGASSFQAHPVDALVLAVSLDLPLYVSHEFRRASPEPAAELPEAFAQFIAGLETLEGSPGDGRRPEESGR